LDGGSHLDTFPSIPNIYRPVDTVLLAFVHDNVAWAMQLAFDKKIALP
jgi:hypothetical protein